MKAQTIIKGSIFNKEGQPLPRSGITLSHPRDEFIVTFTFSEQDGSYALTVNHSIDSLLISVSHLGYKTINQSMSNSTQDIDFFLEPQPFQIKEVVVKAPLIEQSGDTIKYSVPSFMRGQDRAIGDVLRRLPGIDVLTDGRVLYQGKPIQKYYIEGLDLLGGRYNLANNNLPAESVSQVQIIENHQPIQILDSLVFSDRASLNIKLKRNVAWAGTAQLGSGIEPFLWDAAATPMLFSRNHQMILAYQTNNVGENVARELNTLTIEDLLSRIHTPKEKNDWVQLQTLPKPALSEKTWLDNTSHLGSANYLLRLPRQFELKLNTSYLNHSYRQRGDVFSQLLTPLDTITYQQQLDNELLDHAFAGTLTLTRNNPRNYLVNELEFNSQWDKSSGFVIDNTSGILQERKSPIGSFHNRFNTMLPLGNQIVSIRSFVTYTHTAQSLVVSPAPFADFLSENQNKSLDALRQDVGLTSFFTHNLLSFTRKIGVITVSPQIGFLVHSRKLESDLWKINQGNKYSPGDEYKNQLLFDNRTAYTTLTGQYRNKGWRVEASGRVSYSFFDIENQGNQQSRPDPKIDFEPSLSLHKDLSSKWKLSSEISKKRTYGSIEHLYEGYILSHYRLLQRNNPAFLEQNIQNIRIYGSYRNILLARFFNWGYSYARTENNLIYSHYLDPEGFTVIQAFERPAIQNTHSLIIRLSQFLRPVQTHISISPNYTLTKQEFLINDKLATAKTHIVFLNARFEKEIFNWWETVYSVNTRTGITYIKPDISQKINNWSHVVELNFYPGKTHNFNLEAEYYQSKLKDNNRSSFLLNFSYNIKLPQRNLELYLNWNNILNTQIFQTKINSPYGMSSRLYILRPSELFFGVRYSF